PGTSGAVAFIERNGGAVVATMETINGFVAEVPAHLVSGIASFGSVASVTQDFAVDLSGAGWDTSGKDATAMPELAQDMAVDNLWTSGLTGKGVTVALIDSGVTRVEGLKTSGKVINGPDLSFDSQIAGMEYLDAYGHGTHLAGIIAGRDSSAPATLGNKDLKKHFLGVAPDARILNMKVGAADGAVDVSQVLAAIDWVVQHRNDNGMNVRVMNLSFGTNSSQSYLIDPLAYAVQVAWNAGIVVVVAAGNDGNSQALRNPATNPYVIAVGALDTQGNGRQGDNRVATYSNCGTNARSVDLVAPGESIASLRVPGSYADVNYPGAVVDGTLFKGTGSSQAAAAVSGAAALLLEKYPTYTPDQVKAHLKANTTPVYGNPAAKCVGAGQVEMWNAYNALPVGPSVQNHTQATGTGTLEGARGSDHLENSGVVLAGELDIFGMPFVSSAWAPLALTGSSWSGGDWNGSSWSGSSWSGSSWSGSSWSGSSWSGSSWSGSSWSGAIWNGSSWSGSSWSGSSWSGSSWSGNNWTGLSWDHGKRSIR
ncbi:MAG: S8 family serine peptidase, partial [Acidimicrobiia bacterium]|nr:S8 family serine peptidase [Acidimicrobiia bacterium]